MLSDRLLPLRFLHSERIFCMLHSQFLGNVRCTFFLRVQSTEMCVINSDRRSQWPVKKRMILFEQSYTAYVGYPWLTTTRPKAQFRYGNAKKCSQNFHALRLQSATTPQWLQISRNSLPNWPSMGCLVSIFTVRINLVLPLSCTLCTGNVPIQIF